MIGISINKKNRHLLHDYANAGFSIAEMLLPASDGSPKSLEQLLAYGAETAARIRDAGLTLRTVHLPFSVEEWNPSHPAATVRGAAVAGQCALIRACAAWGARYAVMHVSCGPVPDEDRPFWERNCTESLRVMAGEAEACGVRILAENLPKRSLVNGSAPLLRVTEGCALADICFDVNHLFLETHADFVRAVGPWIRSTHLSDYDGVEERHWPPGMGIVPWKQVVRDLCDVGYQGPWLFEVGTDGAGQPYAPETIAASFAALVC